MLIKITKALEVGADDLIKNFMAKKDYSKLSKEELLKIIEKLESRKKYGLVWDEAKTKEKFEKESENALPVLKEVKSKEIKTDPTKPINILIEGDNYHALSVLSYTHQGKIDIIYIDPPYNTGKKKEFKYNDAWVNKEDSYRHSKWLSFMNKRLFLAKKLLKEDGLIFISIDDNEQAQLKLLCDAIFGENNFIANFIIDKTAQGANQSVTFKTQHEFCLLYAKNNALQNVNYEVIGDFDKRKFKHKDEKGYYAITNSFDSINSPLIKNKNRGYTVYYNKNTEEAIIRDEYDRENNKFSEYDNNLIKKGFTPIRPGIRKGVQYPWNWKRERFLKDYREELVFQKNKKGNLNIYHKNRATGITKDTTIKRFDTRLSGNQLVTDILGAKLFDYPKSIDMMKWVLSKHKNKNSIILDFFSGSGTTGHAVLELNKEDKGNRNFILCTNNEENICTDVCYPRVEKAIKGYKIISTNKKVDGLGGNLKYFKTAFVKNSISQDDLKMRITRECTEMLCLREGIFNEIKAKTDYHIFKQNGRVMGIYYALEREDLASLKKDLDKIKGKKILYCFTLDPLGLDKEDFVDWQGVSLEPIPQKILDIYEQIYEY